MIREDRELLAPLSLLTTGIAPLALRIMEGEVLATSALTRPPHTVDPRSRR